VLFTAKQYNSTSFEKCQQYFGKVIKLIEELLCELVNEDTIKSLDVINYYDNENKIMIPLLLKKGEQGYKNRICKELSIYDLCELSFILVIHPKLQSKIYNYEGSYEYNIDIYKRNNPDKVYKSISINPSDDKKEYINRIIWNGRDVRLAVQYQIEDALKDRILEDDLELFVDRSDGDEYRGVWRSKKNNSCVCVTVNDIYNPECSIDLMPCGYVLVS
jgi:hypothetical protein